MKFSTILIVVGIMIMIAGGIVFMNTTNTHDAKKTGLAAIAESANNAYMDKPQQPLNTPMMIIFIGIVAVIVGAYDSRRTPSIEK